MDIVAKSSSNADMELAAAVKVMKVVRLRRLHKKLELERNIQVPELILSFHRTVSKASWKSYQRESPDGPKKYGNVPAIQRWLSATFLGRFVSVEGESSRRAATCGLGTFIGVGSAECSRGESSRVQQCADRAQSAPAGSCAATFILGESERSPHFQFHMPGCKRQYRWKGQVKSQHRSSLELHCWSSATNQSSAVVAPGRPAVRGGGIEGSLIYQDETQLKKIKMPTNHRRGAIITELDPTMSSLTFAIHNSQCAQSDWPPTIADASAISCRHTVLINLIGLNRTIIEQTGCK
ncbi:hypothetical protein J6590_010872 [Homalodisca vitripennis]|nr:hypothetical protein J6590_010872 [Homalodisca vitripennis]